jgi:heptaprenylglyceryl phosphate synthase
MTLLDPAHPDTDEACDYSDRILVGGAMGYL